MTSNSNAASGGDLSNAGSSSAADQDPIYALPKVYNGKTVTDLFPEFKYDTVLRFSKLFGLGKTSSLPKIWKGTRKRKKNKNDPPDLNRQQTLNEEKSYLDESTVAESERPITSAAAGGGGGSEDLFDEKEADKAGRGDVNDLVATLEELEFEPDDEIELRKPLVIEKRKNQNGKGAGESQFEQALAKSEIPNEVLYGPASYWYQKSEYADLARTALKERFLNGKHGGDKATKSEPEADGDGEKKDENGQMNGDQEAAAASECGTICLGDAIEKLADSIKDEAYLLINTLNWEESIILDPTKTSIPTESGAGQASLNAKVVDMINERVKYAGWVASAEHPNLYSFQSRVLGKKLDLAKLKELQQSIYGGSTAANAKQASNQGQSLASFSSIFPNENYEFINGDWESQIVLDPKDTNLHEMREYFIDLNDENILLDLAEPLRDADDKENENADKAAGASGAGQSGALGKHKEKGKAGEGKAKAGKPAGRAKDDDDNEKENKALGNDDEKNTADGKNFWNLSNDDYYNPKIVSEPTATVTSKTVSTALVIQHSLAAVELRKPFFPTNLSSYKLRNFHRYALKRATPGYQPVNTFNTKMALTFNTANLNKQNKKEQAGGAAPVGKEDIVRNVSALTAADCSEIVLAEYSEQYPPLMMQASMSTKIRNYYKKRFAKDENPDKNLEYGELVHINNSPFLGALKPGECLQALENYMFRAPVYQHKFPDTDFLVVRTKHLGYVIRGDIRNLFVVGQQCPLIEVPGPNSKRANSFIKDFLQAYMFRLFHRSDETPKCIRMEDIKAAFPNLAENSIRKRLKIFADFKRTANSNLWLLRDDVRLPSEEEIRSIVTPEQVCAYYSMLAAEQRLKDAGYGEKNLFASDDEDVDNMKIDDEVKNAPWHTTRAYLDAIKGKCLLQINGVADPTGRGEGFSYVRQPFKTNKQEGEAGAGADHNQSQSTANAMNESISSPMPNQPAAPQPAAAPKRTVTGTDADLRRLHLSQAKELLAKYGVPDEEIRKLKRWEIIDVVRTMSTQKAKESSNSDVSKFARGGTKYSQSDAHEKYREECQRLFELQNRNLASEEYLSTDEDESSEQDSDVDEMGKNLESMLQNRMAASGSGAAASDAKQSEKSAAEAAAGSQENAKQNKNRVLRITRTYVDEETGQSYTKVEIVKKQPVIDAYLKIRSTKDDEYIRTAFGLDETEKEKLRKERRRLQEQLRRVKRSEAKRASEANAALKKLAKQAKKNMTPKTPKTKLTGVRKTPKQPGEKKMTKKARLAAEAAAAAGLLNQSNEESSMLNMSDRFMRQNMSSCDENSFMTDLTLNKLNSSASMNLNDTQDPSVPLVKPKRKYQKRKKPGETADASMNASLAGANPDDSMNASNTTLSLSKLEGTKLIIQKKAIKMALNSDDTTTGEAAEKKPKTPRITKKALKLMQMGLADGSMSLPDGSLDGSLLTGKSPAKKEKSSLILHIPKDKIGLPKTSSTLSSTSNLKTSSDNNLNLPSTSNSGTSSPAVDVTSVTDPMSAVPNLMALKQQMRAGQQPGVVKEKRAYNKQNSTLKKQRQLMEEQAAAAVAAANQSNMQMVNQLSSLLSTPFSPFLGDPNQAAAALLSQALFSPNAFGLPTTPDAAAAAAFSSLFFQQQTQPQQQQQSAPAQQQQQAPQRKKSTASTSQQLDYLTKPPKKVDRRHIDPLVSFASILENILNELRDKEEAQPFLIPVNPKKVPDYFMIIKKPIDLQMIRKRINDKYYKNRTSFLDDMNLLVQNSILYNGKEHQITYAAERLYSACTDMFGEHEGQLVRLEKAINPLLDDNSLIAFNYILDQIFEQQIMTVDNSFSFLKPVNKTKYKDYYELIRNPIDLERIKSRITTKKYKSRQQFIGDFELLFNNSLKYNGPNNIYTDTAAKLLEACKNSCEYAYNDQLGPLEDNIAYVLEQQQLELDEASSMAVATSSGLGRSSSDLSGGHGNLVRTNSFSKGASSSNNGNLMNQQQQMKKKVKPNPPKTPNTPTNFSASSSGGASSSNKTKIFEKPKMKQQQQQHHLFGAVSNQNSPKSASDAEVFVDVESIDDVKSMASHRLSKMLHEPTKYHQNNPDNDYDDQMDF